MQRPLRINIWSAWLGAALAVSWAVAVAARTASAAEADWRVLGEAQGLASNDVNALAADEGSVYIGTRRGLSVWAKPAGALAAFPQQSSLPDRNVRSLLTDKSGLWVGTPKGLARVAAGRVDLIAASGAALRINALAVRQGKIYAGTDRGLWTLAPGGGALEPVPGLTGEEVALLKNIDDGLLVGLAGGRLVNFQPDSGSLEPLAVEFNPLHNKVVAIGFAADNLWFATDGSGLIRYDRANQEWSSYAQSSTVDKFLSALIEDGKYIWFGTFYGLYRLDQDTNQWFSPEADVFKENVISALCLDGDELWVGTHGSGVVHGHTGVPHLKTTVPKKYLGNEKVVLRGRIQGAGPFQTRVEYAALPFPKIWLNRYVTLTTQADDYQVEVDFGQLADNYYRFKVIAEDSRRTANEDLFTLVKETAPLALTFKSTQLKAGTNSVEGTYGNPTINAILLSPGQVAAVLDRPHRTFTAKITLHPGDREIQAEASDVMGRKKVFTLAVSVAAAPQLAITPALAAFTPGLDEVLFTITHNFSRDMVHWQLIIATESGTPVFTETEDSPLPTAYVWDGKADDKKPVPGGALYIYVLKVKDADGNEMSTPKDVIRANALMTVQKEKRGLVLKLSSSFLFDQGKAEIKDRDRYLFDELMKIVHEHPKSMLLVEGHTDSKPIQTFQYPSNQQLSEARALNVAEYMIQNYGIDRKRVTTVGYGESKPAAGNQTEAGREKNRRVEIVILGD